MPLGLRPNWEYELKTVPFRQGSKLILYSDALVEVEHLLGEFLGDEGLKNEVNEIWHQDIEPDERLSELIRRFHMRAGTTADDDLTIIYIENTGKADGH